MGRAVLQPYPGPCTPLLCSLQSRSRAVLCCPEFGAVLYHPQVSLHPHYFCPSAYCMLLHSVAAALVWKLTSHCIGLGSPSSCVSCVLVIPDKIRVEIIMFVLFRDSVHALLVLLVLTHLHLNYIIVFPINQYHYKIEHPRNRVTLHCDTINESNFKTVQQEQGKPTDSASY